MLSFVIKKLMAIAQHFKITTIKRRENEGAFTFIKDEAVRITLTLYYIVNFNFFWCEWNNVTSAFADFCSSLILH